MTRPLAIIILCASVVSSTAAEADVAGFLKLHCYSCHGEKKQKGELRLDTLPRDFTEPGIAGRWADVLEKISSREMPPEEEPQPDAAESARFVEQISLLIKEGESARLARRDPVSMHKLTREEYVNTLHDLLGVFYDAADPNGLPEDPEWNGFERLGSVLTLAPSHVEKYLQAARTVLAESLPDKRPEPLKHRIGAHEMSGRPKDWQRAVDEGWAARVRQDIWPNWHLRRASPKSFPADGVYRMRIQVSGLRPSGGQAPHLVVYAEDIDRVLHEQEVDAPEDNPVVVEFTTHLTAGSHAIFVRNESPGPPFTLYSSRDGNSYTPFFNVKDQGRQPWQLKLTDEEGRALWPFLLVDWIQWEGPLLPEGPTLAQKNYLPVNAGDRAQASEALSRFAERAWRRPVGPDDLARLMKVRDAEIAAGEEPLAALRTAMAAVLCSKDFLYLVEGSPERKDGRLSAWELASRLSYFLWSTLPDEPLINAARDGSLTRPEVLRAQFARMMADAKAARFSEAFPRSWLQLRKLGTFPPDKMLYPDYTKQLEASMAHETTAFFHEVLERDLTLREFLHSDWTMLNSSLAQHYGVPGIDGGEFRRITLPAGSHRGGLLTQASILSLTSDGTRHRPVHRGKWVMDSIFGRPVPPPPGNIDPIEPTPPTQPKATLRQKLEAHKSDVSCAECHRKIDPLGLAFDHYDAIGRWRTEEVMNDGAGANPKVDASGELPDGRRFADQDGFKRLLLDDLDKFNSAVAEKLAMFALRRTLNFDDRAQLAAVAARCKESDFKLRALVEAFVLSDLFQKR